MVDRLSTELFDTSVVVQRTDGGWKLGCSHRQLHACVLWAPNERNVTHDAHLYLWGFSHTCNSLLLFCDPELKDWRGYYCGPAVLHPTSLWLAAASGPLPIVLWTGGKNESGTGKRVITQQFQQVLHPRHDDVEYCVHYPKGSPQHARK